MTALDEARPRTAVTDPDPLPPAPGGRRRLVTLVLVGVTLAAGSGTWLWAANRTDDTTPTAAAPVATARVERGNLSATERWDGTLGHGTPFAVRTGAGGTITRLIEQDAIVGPGDVLFHVDEQPVVLLSGVVPMYRDLSIGDSGADVQQLESNLAAWGYTGFPVDDQFTSSTADAVRAWQQSIGAAATGMVARGAVVFAPAGGKVETLQARVGDAVAPGASILAIAGTDQVVSLDAEIDDLDRFTVGSKVVVVLPSGDETTGTVEATRVVEDQAEPMASGGATSTAPLVQVDIALDAEAPDPLVGAQVEVVVAVDQRTDVLLVPVTALLALAEGGYGLEVVADDGTTSIVPVDTGLFAEGKVEVSSPDIAEGAVVGVAGR